jgi:hypothetical protein
MAGLSFADEKDADVFYSKLTQRESSKSSNSKNKKKKKGKTMSQMFVSIDTYVFMQ